MPYEVRRRSSTKGAPVAVETIQVPDPGPGEVVVDVQHAAYVTQTFTTAKAQLTTNFRFFSVMRPQGL